MGGMIMSVSAKIEFFIPVRAMPPVAVQPVLVWVYGGCMQALS